MTTNRTRDRLGSAALALAIAILLLGVLAALARIRERTAALDLFAHRGFASEAPENTVRAARAAVDRADAIEIDVRRCGSGELVCVHDETLERLTGFDARVDETDWETLRELEPQLEVASGDGEGAVETAPATIARFDDVLEAIAESARDRGNDGDQDENVRENRDEDGELDVLLNVELKERGLADDVLERLASYDGPVLLSSFDPRALAEVRARDGEIPLAYVFRSPGGALSCDALETAAALECDAVHPRADLPFRSAIVPRAHRRGFVVNAWTVDSRLETALLALVGVDGVFADSSRVRVGTRK